MNKQGIIEEEAIIIFHFTKGRSNSQHPTSESENDADDEADEQEFDQITQTGEHSTQAKKNENQRTESQKTESGKTRQAIGSMRYMWQGVRKC